MRSYSDAVGKLFGIGSGPVRNRQKVDYKTFGITSDDAAALIEIASNDLYHFSIHDDEALLFAPIHALCALASLEDARFYPQALELVEIYADDDYIAATIVTYAGSLGDETLGKLSRKCEDGSLSVQASRTLRKALEREEAPDISASDEVPDIVEEPEQKTPVMEAVETTDETEATETAEPVESALEPEASAFSSDGEEAAVPGETVVQPEAAAEAEELKASEEALAEPQGVVEETVDEPAPTEGESGAESMEVAAEAVAADEVQIPAEETTEEPAPAPNEPHHTIELASTHSIFDRFDGGFAPVSSEPKAGRNDPCPCGSGKKYKKCCMNKK